MLPEQLPPNSSAVEKALIAAWESQLQGVDTQQIERLAYASTATGQALAIHANDRQLSNWDSEASVQWKRQRITGEYPARAERGMRAAILKAANANGFTATILPGERDFEVALKVYHDGISALTPNNISVLLKSVSHALNLRDSLQVTLAAHSHASTRQGTYLRASFRIAAVPTTLRAKCTTSYSQISAIALRAKATIKAKP